VTTTKEAPVLDTLREAVDNAAADRVFGAPIHHDGVVVLPVAKVSGGGGGGTGTGPAPEGQENGGTGGGFGMSAKPLGVFVIKNGKVTWRPAIDVNRVVLGGQIVAVTGLLVLRALIKAGVIRPGRGHPVRQLTEEARHAKNRATARIRKLPRPGRRATP
jgi:uncharacterized spore protein YtfJ